MAEGSAALREHLHKAKVADVEETAWMLEEHGVKAIDDLAILRGAGYLFGILLS